MKRAINKIMIVFGTRPEAIKLAPVINKLREDHSWFEVIVCVTAQHREMLDQVLNVFSIKPDFDLNIMRNNQSIFNVTINGLQSLEKVLNKVKPDMVLVQGDTTTTFIAGLAAFYCKIPVGHVEAGLRTGDKYNPFPEEMNRRLGDILTDLYFTATDNAKHNLLKEGIDEKKIYVTGNTVIDALLFTIKKQRNNESERRFVKYFQNNYGLCFNDRKIILVTGHRRESFGEEFKNMCDGIKKIALQNKDIDIVYPVHLNPNVQRPVKNILNDIKNIHLIDHLDYASFVWLMNKCYFILTDSGGIQEEAPALGKPVLVMRAKTERMEAIELGASKLLGTNSEIIFQESQHLLVNKEEYNRMSKAGSPFGDGKAAHRIAKVLKKYISS
jgi:UDP-N-acetylglucosamine 2-epimerase (non-hydrolysing)